ncbi:MAG: hypothetical protein KKA65_05080 [Nanoarchaeota archaeon]|nr:hypothetical protein [Nanoarchaeota archaeon]MBU4241720.1 hypothetical protein [Nanoarchaeota archaeon]MBU4351767.1 hypothetical protein [Nanoarchaeota archaeon]MBU4456848.1 hypothetical protein [Nanoarchaeota archaeon]MCG2719461.1 hypothetical protein [Nanoarchaeota archaeon]
MDKLELKNRTIDALVLGFKKPIMYDLYLPDLKIVLKSFQHSMNKLFREKYQELEEKHYADINNFFKKPALEYIFKPIKEMRVKVKESLIEVLGKQSGHDYGGTYWNKPYIEYVFKNSERYEEVIFPNLGSLYKFKEEREEVKKEVRKHFNKAEMENFYQLHKHMQAYVDNHFKIQP